MENKKIIIDPVTRIEGHAKITIDLDDSGKVKDAKIHVTQYRGFEKFCEGRVYTEMPALTARTCGICPVSHVIASSKAIDEILSITPPQAGINIRKIINLAQLLQSHTLNFFHLSSPDFVYGFDAPKEDRNIFKMMQTHPQRAKDGIKLRAFGQKIIEDLAGKRIHPTGIIPGGVEHRIELSQKEAILEQIPDMLKIAQDALEFFKTNLHKFKDEIDSFATFPSLFMALTNDEGTLEHYDGFLRFIDSEGEILQDRVEPKDYKEFIGEAVEEDSYLKSPYYKPLGYPKGMYRVGALARLNIASTCGTPLADEELKNFKAINGGKPVLNSFYYHYARLIEMIYAIEKIEELLKNDETMSEHVKTSSKISREKGIGCSEAPRGTLFHEYHVTKYGIITAVNLLIATGNNNLAMNAGVKQVAKKFVDAKNITEGALNRVEAVIRCFDPCLSCSTHALGIVSSRIEVRDHNKNILKVIERN
ncbi:MAG: NADP oxidoreductase [Sulfurimonas sp. RIFOXYD12_FULL_33_39]|uniref:Ni/Fe hydrogenase subunit alpha n=1 Tax=unclassified Sulfurimonas TaxID=2623549 RepID=UPI0008CCF7B2|nr:MULTISPECIES: Ni/Fe hydrogenase subunit alpha [unclassified Sulfurimonas]OHE04098.1 MAG: NADP oxidoreductase [Sulfurimonas sp. RIFCSPLOWO2_12_FULL_34_6]OHE10050.1 MAG: NADP oxidoreductase [Sulfurimonas sp. RIFOXYD12_FULL_33_39]OHE14729.1 MAG: NADP oxidoreductase [Sulfurimonas sp. RIFOXYD2_FULL_34_21]DAB28667.1 MAG TPA: Ni/Fe hydrogenase subunit alpha [Sulfurimonas sp. UBA10385]